VAYSSSLKLETCSSETSVDFKRTTWCYIKKIEPLLWGPQICIYCHLASNRRENIFRLSSQSPLYTYFNFLRVLRFPLPIFIPSTAPHSSSNIRSWYNRPVSDRRTEWTQTRPTPRKLKLILFMDFLWEILFSTSVTSLPSSWRTSNTLLSIRFVIHRFWASLWSITF
jgi:hypothetical protein